MSTATVERGARRKAERRAFLEGRQHGVGGSDAAAIVGKDPDKFVWDVWDEKVLDIKVEPDELMSGDIKRGNAGEPHAIKEYAERTGHRVQVHRDEFVHPKHAWMKGNVDGVIHPTLGDREGLGILEVKCPRVAKFYEIRDEGLGLREVFQMQHYLGVTGLKWGAFAVFTAEYWDLTTFETVRDDALIGWLIEEERKFWEDHVLTGRRPERPPPVVPTMEKPKGRATMRKDDAWLEAAVLVVARHYDLADAELQYAESEATLISLAPEEGALHLAGGGVTLGRSETSGRRQFDRKKLVATIAQLQSEDDTDGLIDLDPAGDEFHYQTDAKIKTDVKVTAGRNEADVLLAALQESIDA